MSRNLRSTMRHESVLKLRTGALIGAVTLILPALAAAQQTQRDTIRPIALDSVQVRVLRTPITELQAPLAVAVLGELELRQAKSGAFLEEALRGLPGVLVQNRFNFALGERVVVRGFGGRAQFGVRGINLIVDGIPATLADGQGTLDHLDIGSLGRVEVVRGAASALFGNASGGVVAFESRLPPARPVQLEAEYVGGSNGLSRAQGTATGTVSGTGYLLNVSTQGWEGYRPNPIAGSSLGSLYGTADRIMVNGQLRRDLFGGPLAFTVNYLDLDSQNPGELLKTQIDSLSRTAHGAGPVNNVTRLAGKDITQTQAGLRWEGPLGSLDSDVSLFGLTRSTLSFLVPTIVPLDRTAGGGRLHLAKTGATRWGPMTGHVGAEVAVMSDDRLNFANINGERGPSATVDQNERVSSTGVFLQANVSLPASANALAGIRYDRHEFKATDHIQRTGTEPSRTGDRSMSQVSPSLGVNVPVTGDINLFANVGKEFETPSTTELGNRPDGGGGFNPDLMPQTGVGGEIGLKGRLGQVASFEVSGYRTDLKNEIVRFQVPTLPGRDFFRNAGTSRHTGVEATLSASAPSGVLDGRLTYTYTNARFRTFVQDGVDVGGNRIPGLAPHRADGVVRVMPGSLLGRLEDIYGELTASYLSNVPVNDRNTEGFEAPSYFVMDVRAGIRAVRFGSFSLSPWAAVTNLTDEYYIAAIVPNAAAAAPTAARYYDPGPARSFQLGLRAIWGN